MYLNWSQHQKKLMKPRGAQCSSVRVDVCALIVFRPVPITSLCNTSSPKRTADQHLCAVLCSCKQNEISSAGEQSTTPSDWPICLIRKFNETARCSLLLNASFCINESATPCHRSEIADCYCCTERFQRYDSQAAAPGKLKYLIDGRNVCKEKEYVPSHVARSPSASTVQPLPKHQ